jgi:hypothetical protein
MYYLSLEQDVNYCNKVDKTNRLCVLSVTILKGLFTPTMYDECPATCFGLWKPSSGRYTLLAILKLLSYFWYTLLAILELLNYFWYTLLAILELLT